MVRLSSKFRALLVSLFILIVWYSVLFGFIMSVKDAVLGYMINNNMTKLTISKVVYNTTSNQWVSQPEIIDVAGILDLGMTILLVFGPIIYVIQKIAR